MTTPYPIFAFNRGLVSPLALARVDLKRLALSAETMTNWMPRTLGSMTMRPGLEHLESTKDDAQAIHIDFVFSTDDLALIEITSGAMRVYVDDAIISRGTVAATVANGTFDTDLASWTDADESGAASIWETGGYLNLIGTDFNSAIRKQEVTVDNAGAEHALKIVINRGPVTIIVGSTDGADDYINKTSLDTGEHSLAFTPTGNFFIQLSSKTQYKVLVDSITVESAGDMTLTAPWAASDLSSLRWTQSGDIIFIASDGFQQYKIERRATRSWSLVKYETADGPYRVRNISTVSLTPSALNGDITLTASDSAFRSTDVGALRRLTSVGQVVEADVTGEGEWTNSIRVIGVESSRIFQLTIEGTWTATVTLQRSIDEEGSWTDVAEYTSNQAAVSFDDGLDNQIAFYRIGVDTGDFTSGTVECQLSYSGGGLAGDVRITGVTSATVVSAAVLNSLGNTTSTTDWSEGIWSDRRGWPTSTAIYEGRLWWPGKDWVIGSVSDSFISFEEDTEGDSGPIVRTIGFGPVDTINWVLPLQRLLLGAEGAEISARSTSFDEPLTKTNFNLKNASTQGSTGAAAVVIDTTGIFIQRSGLRIYSLSYGFEANDYQSGDLTTLFPDLGSPGFVQVVVARQPDTRVHVRRSDGTVAILVFLPAEDVKCWVNFETDGEVEDMVVLPGTTEDAVYYTVKRTVNGVEKRFLEKWAMESECIGGALNKQADSFKSLTRVAITAVTGLAHLEGEEVVVWADGKDVGTTSSRTQTYTVSGGEITLDEAAANVVVGRPYSAQFKNAKFAFQPLEHVLTTRYRVVGLGLMMANTHYQGLRYGESFDNLDELPLVEKGAVTAADTVWESYDNDSFVFAGDTSTDPRICLQADAPRPCTILAAVPVLDR